jgi:TolB-like protein/Tfp pilus assembly protein PilF
MTVIALSLFTGRAEEIDSIAVLPFENLTGDTGQEYFVDGITNELIGQLGQISALRVISRTSVMQYKGVNKPLPEIARELNVDAVVEGTVQRVGDRVHIRATLLHGPTDRHLWGQSYERDLQDILALQNEVARSIVDEIKVKLTPEEKGRLASARQVNPEAYEDYLKGKFHWYKLSPEDLETALQYFESALEKDPDYALAHTGIALVWLGRQQVGLVPPSEAAPKAKKAALRALELDSTLSEAHYTVALIRTWNEWDWEGAETAFQQAIELNPNYPDARAYYSHLLCYMGRPEEAIAQIEQALELDPLNSLFQGLYGNVSLYMHRYDDAIVHARNALRTSPNDPMGNAVLWPSFHMKGMYEEALAAAKAFFSGIGLTELEEVFVRGYAEDGYSGAMSLVAETLAEFSRTAFIAPWFISYAYALAGKKDQTLEWLEKCYETKDPNMPYITDPIFDFLLDDPRFQDLLRRMNLPEGK